MSIDPALNAIRETHRMLRDSAAPIRETQNMLRAATHAMEASRREMRSLALAQRESQNMIRESRLALKVRNDYMRASEIAAREARNVLRSFDPALRARQNGIRSALTEWRESHQIPRLVDQSVKAMQNELRAVSQARDNAKLLDRELARSIAVRDSGLRSALMAEREARERFREATSVMGKSRSEILAAAEAWRESQKVFRDVESATMRGSADLRTAAAFRETRNLLRAIEPTLTALRSMGMEESNGETSSIDEYSEPQETADSAFATLQEQILDDPDWQESPFAEQLTKLLAFAKESAPSVSRVALEFAWWMVKTFVTIYLSILVNEWRDANEPTTQDGPRVSVIVNVIHEEIHQSEIPPELLQQFRIVNYDQVCVRDGASRKAAKIATLDSGQVVTMIERCRKWTYVTWEVNGEDHSGWVLNKRLSHIRR